MQWDEREAVARRMFDDVEVIDKNVIEQVHKATGIKTEHLHVAFHSTNDPFYTDTPATRRDGEWFAQYYHDKKWGTTHIRRCHYQLLSLQAPKPNGEIYRMEDDIWLYNIAKVARRLHLIPIDALEDHRNDEPLQFVPNEHTPKVHISNHAGFDAPELPDLPSRPDYWLGQYEDGSYRSIVKYPFRGIQRYSLVLMCEKTTMNDILEPLARRYGMYLQTAAGEMALYRIYKLAEWIKKRNKPTVVFYVSDFDKSGNGMPVTVGNNLDWCLQELDVDDIPVQLYPLVLTNEQVEQYTLPRMPVRTTLEDKMDGFEKAHGTRDVTELDALEALHPGVLRTILVQAIDHYYDTAITQKEKDRVQAIEKDISALSKEVHTNSTEDIDDLEDEYEEKKQEFDMWLEDFNPRLKKCYGVAERTLQQRLQEHIKEKAKENEWQPEEDDDTPTLEDAYPLPEAKEAPDYTTPLYDSTWNHYDKVVAFKKKQGKYIGDDITQQEQATAAQEQEQQATIDDLQERIRGYFGNGKLNGIQRTAVGKLLLALEPLMIKHEFTQFYMTLPHPNQSDNAFRVSVIVRTMKKAREA